MADDREPPPLFGEEENIENDADSDDLFKSASESKSPTTQAEDDDDKEDIFADAAADVENSEKPAPEPSLDTEIPLNDDESEKPGEATPPITNGGMAEISLDGDQEQPAAASNAETEVPLDSPEEEDPFKVPANSSPFDQPASADAEDTTPRLQVSGSETAFKATGAGARVGDGNDAAAKPTKPAPEEVEEERDLYTIEISITEPMKKGDGMSAYMAYKVNTKTTLPQFRRRESSVYRRFSDFLGLYEKLNNRHLPDGRVVPPPPEKSVVGMTKIKMAKEDPGSQDFVEKRRASLERFLVRISRHQVLRIDPDFREFLELEGDLPKAHSTSALSGAGVMRLFSKVGDSFGKIAFKMEETDQWFEEKQTQLEALDAQLRKLHTSIEALVQYRKELAFNTGQFARSAAMLGNAEEHTALSRALSQLAEIEEKVDQLHLDQADGDFFVLAELVKDYVTLIGAVKDVFHERVKIFKMWKETEANLQKKKEQRAKLEQQRKLEKVPVLSHEITEMEKKLEQGQDDFEKISRNIRVEMKRFEVQRVRDFKTTIVHYLEGLMNTQQQVIKHWETFLPEAKAIV